MVTTFATVDTHEVEARRNYVPDPRFTMSTWGGTVVAGGGAVEFTSPADSTGNMLIGPAVTELAAATVSFSLLVENVGALAFAVEPRIWDGVAYVTSAGVTIPPGESRLVKIESAATAGGYAQPRLWKISPSPAGAKIRVSEPILERSPVVGSYFDGGTPAVGNKSYAWAGAVNGSESIEYETVPVHTVVPVLVDGYEATRAAGSLVHEVLGASFPDVSLRPAGPRRGQFRMLFATEAAAVDAYADMAYTGLFTAADPEVPGIGMRFVVAGGDLLIGLDAVTRNVWWVEVPFVEVGP